MLAAAFIACRVRISFFDDVDRRTIEYLRDGLVASQKIQAERNADAHPYQGVID